MYTERQRKSYDATTVGMTLILVKLSNMNDSIVTDTVGTQLAYVIA